MKNALTSILPFVIILSVIAIYFAYGLCRVKQIPSPETIENILHEESWGNLETLPPTPQPYHDLEQGPTVPQPVHLKTTRYWERRCKSADLTRFHLHPPHRLSLTYNRHPFTKF